MVLLGGTWLCLHMLCLIQRHLWGFQRKGRQSDNELPGCRHLEVRLERCVVRPFFYEEQALRVLTVHVYGVRDAARLCPRTMNMLKA